MVFFTPVASFQTDYRHREKPSKLPVMYSGKMKKSSWSFKKKSTFDTLSVYIIAGVK